MPARTELPMFHTGLPIHTHRKCGYCQVFRRCTSSGATGKLSQCAACRAVFYCSKACQTANWPSHKAACKARVALRDLVTSHTGISTYMDDVFAWIEYYDAPLKNCAIAAFELRDRPELHAEQHSMLSILLSHKNDLSLPIQHRFNVLEIARNHLHPETSAIDHQLLAGREKCIKMGKIEMGDQYHGTGGYFIRFFEGASDTPQFHSLREPKYFSFDKDTAAARVIPEQFWILLRQYFDQGAKMKFCCGKLDIDGICCCGGWVHDEEKQKLYREAYGNARQSS
ncbi:hypothetical protein C8J56DRAFT_197941 [Mycena floridula]|nr:hypothetical protein C8J56DRAFT_197941 [Mycena floridula]